jgi:hypothetical protein
MKNLRQLCAVTLLTMVFAVSVFAGQIGCPADVDPPPPPEATATGQIGCPALTEAAVSLLQGILSLS